MIDTTGAVSQNVGGYISSGSISTAFSTTATDDLLVVELTYRTTNGSPPTTVYLPSTLSFDNSTITLNQGVAAGSSAGSFHNLAIYYAYISPGVAINSTITGTLPSIGSSGYSLSAFGVTGAITSFTPLSNSYDTGATSSNSLPLSGVHAGDITFAVGINGIGNGSAYSSSGYSTITATSGTVVQNSTPSDSLYAASAANSYTNPTSATSNFANGYVSGLSAGSNTFTYTVTASAGTGGKDVFGVLDFEIVPEPSMYLLIALGLLVPIGWQVYRRHGAA